jgi:hypothetical protein
MTSQEATQLALGYAWGREDASGTRTFAPEGMVGTILFAEAFAGAWEAFNTERIHHMVPVHVAYARWNETGGLTVFPLYATMATVAA